MTRDQVADAVNHWNRRAWTKASREEANAAYWRPPGEREGMTG